MKKLNLLLAIILILSSASFAQDSTLIQKINIGTFSVGTRNTLSAFNNDDATGLGVGGQFRIQLGKSINSEWFFDYITSNQNLTKRNDYHIGWSLMFYSKNNNSFEKLFQPYLLVGHCFDYSKVFEKSNINNNESRLSMATQAGIGTHINISKVFDCSISSQYMLHFGKEIETSMLNNKPIIIKNDFSSTEGHLLFTISFNYKLGKLWNKKA